MGFRGRTQHRCEQHPPSRSDRESSMVAPVWDALDSADVSTCTTAEDLENMLNEVADVLEEVASEYEQSEMYERNEDLQERAETLNSSAWELQSVQFDEEPEDDDSAGWNGHTTFEAAMEEWLEGARATAQEALDAVEVP